MWSVSEFKVFYFTELPSHLLSVVHHAASLQEQCRTSPKFHYSTYVSWLPAKQETQCAPNVQPVNVTLLLHLSLLGKEKAEEFNCLMCH